MSITPNTDIFSLWDNDAIELFYTSSNQVLCNKRLLHTLPKAGFAPASVSIEMPVAPVAATRVVAAQNSNARLEIFYTDAGGIIYRNWRDDDGAWNHHGYLESPTTTAKKIVIAQSFDGTLDLFYVGGDGNLYHNSQASSDSSVTPGGAWNGGEPIAQTPVAAAEIAAARNADGRLELFFTTPAGVLYHAWQLTPGGAWNVPVVLFTGTTKATKITVVQTMNDFLFLSYIGADGLLWRSQQQPDLSWSAPAVFAPAPVGAKELTVVRNAFSLPGSPVITQTLELFYIGADDVLYHDWQLATNTADWNGRKLVYSSNDKASRFSATRVSNGRLELIFVDPSNNLNWIWQAVPGVETWVPPQQV